MDHRRISKIEIHHQVEIAEADFDTRLDSAEFIDSHFGAPSLIEDNSNFDFDMYFSRQSSNFIN